MPNPDVSQDDVNFFPPLMVVFFLLGPFSPEPVSFATLGAEELPPLHPVQSPATGSVGGVDLSLASVKQQGLTSRQISTPPAGDNSVD